MQQTITINGNVFQKYIAEKTIKQVVKSLSLRFDDDYRGDDICFIAILNGAFVFATDIVRQVKIESEIHFVRISSYNGMSSQKITQSISLSIDCKDRNIVILEDIIETGQTIDCLMNQIRQQKPKSLEVCTLLYKPQLFKADYKVKYVGMEIEDEFVVGYGMDYDQRGRCYKDIYQLNKVKNT
ncbi:MAG: hypoxanthine phosphoribosyltransferase [Bacteroidales bacterium]|jgi:hypoxanthine phosphoribosyltransferase|nr:hypoxanthine phosphoribosyltransferase [Bacteroidales bacterium]